MPSIGAVVAMEAAGETDKAIRRSQNPKTSPQQGAQDISFCIVNRFYGAALEILENPRIDLDSAIPAFRNFMGGQRLENGARIIHYLAERKPSPFSSSKTKNQYKSLVEYVLKRPVDLKAKTPDGRTALDIARQHGNTVFLTTLAQTLLAKYAP